MTAQIKALRAVQLSDKEQIVWDHLVQFGPMTRNEIAAGTSLSLSCVCGRVGNLQEKGMVYTSSVGPGNQTVVADPDQENWPARTVDFARSKQLSRIEDFVADFKPRLDATTIEGLRRLWTVVKNGPL